MAHSLLTCRNGLGIRSLHPRQIRKSNHHYHEPLIFYSQRISPFRVEHSKTKMKQKKLSKMIAFSIIILSNYFQTIRLLKRIIRGGIPADYSFYFVGGSNFTPTSFDPPSLLTSCIILFASFVNVLLLLQLL